MEKDRCTGVDDENGPDSLAYHVQFSAKDRTIKDWKFVEVGDHSSLANILSSVSRGKGQGSCRILAR